MDVYYPRFGVFVFSLKSRKMITENSDVIYATVVKNIKFDENFCSEEIIKNVKSKVFYGILTYQPQACYSCGHVFDEQIIKHGFKTSVIKMPSISGYHTYLKLKKQRYFCKHCQSTFTLKTNVVAKNCCISNNTKVAIALNAKDKI